jgi:hypothetical protein
MMGPLWRGMGSLGMAQGGGAIIPTDLANLQLWLKADSLTLNDGDAIGTWADSSGAGRNFTQAGAETLKPTFKTNIVNGKSVARFDGGDWLTGGASGWNLGNYTILIAYKPANTTQSGLVSIAKSASNRFFLANRFYSLGATGYGVTGVAEEGSIAGTTDAGTWYIAGVRWKPAGLDVILNTTAGTLSNNAATPASIASDAECRIGQRYGSAFTDAFNGDIAEIIMYSDAKSDEDYVLVRAYLATKYAIALA